MSSETIKEFLVGLGFDVQNDSKFFGTIGKASATVAALGATVTAVSGALFLFTERVAQKFDEISDAAGRLKTTANSLAEIGYMAGLTDSSMQQITGTLERFGAIAGEAAVGAGRGVKVFEQIGVNVKDANGQLKDSIDLIFEVGDAIKDMEAGEQLAVAKRLGIDNTAIGVITGNLGHLREEFRDVMQAVGLDVDEAAQKSSDFMDALFRLQFVTSAVGDSLAVKFMDRFTDSVDSLRRLIVDNLPRIMATLEPVIDLVLTLTDIFIALAFRVAQGAGVIIGWIVDIVGTFDKWTLSIIGIVAAWKYLNLAFLATPIGMITALAIAVGLLIDDFMTFQEGGESLIPWSNWETEIAAVISVLEVLEQTAGLVFQAIFGLIGTAIALFSGDFSGAVRTFMQVLYDLSDAFFTLFGPALQYLKDEFGDTFNYLFDLVMGVIDKIMAGVNFVKEALSSITSSIPGVEFLSNAAVSVKNMVTGGGEGGGVTQPLMAPNTTNTTRQKVEQNTRIVVEGSKDPQSTGRAVAAQQGQVNADMVRNLKGAAR